MCSSREDVYVSQINKKICPLTDGGKCQEGMCRVVQKDLSGKAAYEHRSDKVNYKMSEKQSLWVEGAKVTHYGYVCFGCSGKTNEASMSRTRETIVIES